MNIKSVNINSVLEHKKLKGNFYLSEGLIYKELILSKDFFLLKDLCSQISNIGVNKRYYVSDKSRGVIFLSNSDLSGFDPISTCKYVSKKLCYNSERVIKPNMILVSAVGTLGMTAYASSEFEGAMTPIGNLIRLETKNYSGFVYAFLTSKVGQDLIHQLGSGSVQTYLDPTSFGMVPIPKFSIKLMQKIHGLVQEASTLRVEANKLVKQADKLFISNLQINNLDFLKLTHPNESTISSHFRVKRSEIDSLSIRARNYCKRLSLIKEVFRSVHNEKLSELLEYDPVKGGRYRRVGVSPDSENAIELLNQGDIHNLNPKGKVISRKHIDNVDNQTSTKNMVLVPAVGTLGENEIFSRPIFVYGYLENKVLSEHLLRIMPDVNKIDPGYLFIVLQSKLFFRIFRSIVYGTNLLYFILPFLKDMPIPRLTNEVEEIIGNKVRTSYQFLTDALEKEKLAISLVEKEIESWQKL